MKKKKAVYPAKITFFSIERIFRHSNGNQELPINIWKRFSKIIPRTFHRFINHFVSSGCRHMINFETHRPTRPVWPVELSSPEQLQMMAIQQAQSIHLLSELPVVQFNIPACLCQLLLDLFRISKGQPDFGQIMDKGFNMFSIPWASAVRNTKKFQSFKVAHPKLLNMDVYG